MTTDYTPNDMTTIYRHECPDPRCGMAITSRGCATWDEWIERVHWFDADHDDTAYASGDHLVSAADAGIEETW